MIDHAVGGEPRQLASVDAQHCAVAEPPDNRHAVPARQGGHLVARPMDDDAGPLRGPSALVEQKIGGELRAMLRADTGAGSERSHNRGEAEDEAPPPRGVKSINGHDWTPFVRKRNGRFARSNFSAST